MSYEKGSEAAPSTALYLGEIGQYPLLTAQEEVLLAKRIESGRQATEEFLDLIRAGYITDGPDTEEAPILSLVQSYDRIKILENQQGGGAKEFLFGSSKSTLDLVVARLKTGSLLAADETTEAKLTQLKVPIIRGNKARETFIESNLPLVVSIAKKYQRTDIPLLDLIQEGNIGLFHAVDKFKYQKGFKFSTYADWWIRQAITRAISNKRSIVRVPPHIHDKIRALQKLEIKTPDITNQELAERMGVSVEDIFKIRQANIMVRTDSLDKELDETQTTKLGDLIPDQTDVEAETIVASEHLDLHELLDRLSLQEADVLRLRYGLVDNQPKTLDQVSTSFNLSRERIRQIEGRAKNKLLRAGAYKHLPPELARQAIEEADERDEKKRQERNERDKRKREKAAQIRSLGKVSAAASQNS